MLFQKNKKCIDLILLKFIEAPGFGIYIHIDKLQKEISVINLA